MYLNSQEMQKFSQQIAAAIQSVLKMEVTIVDSELTRIAGTGSFASTVGSKIHSGYISLSVIKTGRPRFITDTEHPHTCRNCIEQAACQEKAGLIVPVLSDKTVIGAMGIFVYSEEDKIRFIDNRERLRQFTEKMAEMLSVKIKSAIDAQDIKAKLEILKAVLEEMPCCVMIIDRERHIDQTNEQCKTSLGLAENSLRGKSPEEILVCREIFTAMMTKENMFDIKTKIITVHDNTSHDVVLTVKAVKNGQELESLICMFQEYDDKERKSQKTYLRHERDAFEKIKGNSPPIRRAIALARQVAPSSSTVLLLGESGTGKELFARAIHDLSPRRKEPFIAVNLSSIPNDLLESELFGYEEGAFTGSKSTGKAGKFELAQRGTLFLDEIGDMNYSLQAKILRAIEERSVERLGGTSPIELNIRIISATNKNLEELVAKKLFREDLYYRLNVIPIRLPALKSRKSDLSILIEHFIEKYNQKLDKNIIGVDKYAMRFLTLYDWPGNVRELANAIEYSVHMEKDRYLHYNNLPDNIIRYVSQNINKSQNVATSDTSSLKASGLIDDYEKICQVIDLFGRDTESKRKAAEFLGISLSTLYRRLADIKKNRR